MAIEDKLGSGLCAKCGGLIIERPDNLPICVECSNKFKKFFSKKRPDKVKDQTFLEGAKYK